MVHPAGDNGGLDYRTGKGTRVIMVKCVGAKEGKEVR
jgi:hypothetical protein